MADSGSTPSGDLAHWFGRLTAALLLFSLLLAMPGCSGCTLDPAERKAAEEERKRREELARREKPKPPFEPFQTTVWPLTTNDSEVNPQVFVKPGHWMHVAQRTRANNNDFNGLMVTRCVDRQSRRINLIQSPYQVASWRPVSLPKSQSRELGSTVFIPYMYDREFKQLSIQSRLVARGSGRELTPPLNVPTQSLKSHQYFTLVICPVPERYGHLPKLPTFTPPVDIWDTTGLQVDYVVATPKIDRAVPLPSHPLAWTSLAYLIWDDVEPDKLTLSQQEALVDWLHWGGQLVVVGSRTLTLLRGSFLSEYLPADDSETVELSESSLAALNELWSIPPVDHSGEVAEYQLTASVERPIQVAKLHLTSRGTFAPGTADLIAESRVGRGRIAVTAFGLESLQFRNWKGYDGFVNGAVLRRPGREFVLGEEQFPRAQWADYPTWGSDARINCSLRYFTRDASAPATRPASVVEPVSEATAADELDVPDVPDVPAEGTVAWDFDPPETPYDGFRDDGQAGVGGWSDFSAVADQARVSLQRAAGISVPSSRFVVTVLGVYLVCLVPLNWFAFRLIGRVEWAWFAAPVIAVVGAVAVIRSAHLDIGFVRSRTEIAVVEMQPNHQRAHVSRFTGLYTSLSTQYAGQFADDSALALPFSTAPEPDRLRQQPVREVSYQRDANAALQGFSVLSNSTGMMRSEAMRQLDGTCRLQGRDRDNMLLINDSPFNLQQVVVAARFQDELCLAMLPALAAGQQAPLEFRAIEESNQLGAFLERSEITSQTPPETEVSLRGFYRLGLNGAAIHEGDCRLVAWCDQEVAGMKLQPRPNQETFRTFVLAHLRYGTWGPPQPDANTLADFPRAPN